MYKAICIAELLEQRRGKLSVVASDEFAWDAVLLKAVLILAKKLLLWLCVAEGSCLVVVRL